jgi:hypothetical protein
VVGVGAVVVAVGSGAAVAVGAIAVAGGVAVAVAVTVSHPALGGTGGAVVGAAVEHAAVTAIRQAKTKGRARDEE